MRGELRPKPKANKTCVFAIETHRTTRIICYLKVHSNRFKVGWGFTQTEKKAAVQSRRKGGNFLNPPICTIICRFLSVLIKVSSRNIYCSFLNDQLKIISSRGTLLQGEYIEFTQQKCEFSLTDVRKRRNKLDDSIHSPFNNKKIFKNWLNFGKNKLTKR